MTPPPRPPAATYLEAVTAESARIADLLADTEPGRRVPTCPDWDATDLAWHVAGVQWFWGSLVADSPADPAAARDSRPARPEGHKAVIALLRQATERLLAAVAGGDDSDPVWTWAADDQTLGFVRRRQAHEVLIHRLDAELAASGETTSLDPVLATDGVDELLRVMFAVEPGATFRPVGEPVRITATDTGATWTVAAGLGVGGDDGDEPALVVLDDGTPTPARVAAPATDLDAWLWGRGRDQAVERSGPLDGLLSALGAGIS